MHPSRASYVISWIFAGNRAISAVRARKRFLMSRSHTLIFAMSLVVMLFAPSMIVAAPDSYAKSNSKIPNIQASSAAAGGATDKDSSCILDAPYNNHRGESWIAVDPTNPNHLVGSSKFFFDPLFYLFHLGSYASFDGGNTWSNEVIPV